MWPVFARRRSCLKLGPGKAFFAGEATDTAGRGGTVHGAMATGWRAACEVILALWRG
ncbi:MAG: FAD-dependent oxidoreductase [Verrucomicrobiota bacterium]